MKKLLAFFGLCLQRDLAAERLATKGARTAGVALFNLALASENKAAAETLERKILAGKLQIERNYSRNLKERLSQVQRSQIDYEAHVRRCSR